mgnify:CR=1 FL=1
MAARRKTKSHGAKPRQDAPVALITGGGTGIGAATARLLASHGWRVALNYRASREEAEATAAACRKLGADAIARWRLTSVRQVRRCFRAAVRAVF